MIVPRNRLLFWFGAVVLPAATVGASSEGAAVMSLLIIGLFLFCAVLDAALASGRFSGVDVSFPSVVRLTKGVQGHIELSINNMDMRTRSLRLGLAFPNWIRAEEEEVSLKLPADGARYHFRWVCTPLRRGRHFFDSCYLESSSPLGFWGRRSSIPANIEVRAYPSLYSERKFLSSLFLPRGRFGTRAQRQVGQGREFEKLRDYIHGDSYDTLHWKVTAKRGKPVTKVFQIEKTQEVYVVVDASRLSARPSIPSALKEEAMPDIGGNAPDTILERFITSALVIGLAAERQGDHFGLITFSDKVHRFVRARSGRGHYRDCLDALYTLQPRVVTPDFDELCTFISERLKKRALLIFLSSLDDPAIAESGVKNFGMLRRKHVVLVNMIKPRDARPVFSQADVASIDDIYARLGGHLIWRELLDVGRVIQRKGAGFSLLDNERMCSLLVSQYLSIKERQIL